MSPLLGRRKRETDRQTDRKGGLGGGFWGGGGGGGGGDFSKVSQDMLCVVALKRPYLFLFNLLFV